MWAPLWVLGICVVLLGVACFAGALALARWRRGRRIAAPPPAPLVPSVSASPSRRHPIVLCHGLLGFDALSIGGLPLAYFRGIQARLGVLGEPVFLTRVSPMAPIAVRAAQLAIQIEQLEADRVNLVAHSMGGLDARYAISKLGLASRVASLTTIGTPHRGTPLVDRTQRLAAAFQHPLKWIGGDIEALFDLGTARMTAFNEAVADHPEVRYFSVAGALPAKKAPLGLLTVGHVILRSGGIDSDGLVPVSSQCWGEVLSIVPASHFAQIGWSSGFDTPSFFAELLQTLRARGL
jgi:triacylglycerol lipase